MALATLFPLSVFLMLAFSSFVLMYSEGTVFPAVLTIPLAFAAYMLSERRPIFLLSGWVANLLGLIALGAAALEFFSDNEEGKLLSGIHLLVYLSWLVIFLNKTRQHYWWIIALSVLQVAVSSVLMNEIEYGLFLVLFTMMTIWTISLFTIFNAYQNEPEGKDNSSGIDTGLSRRLNPHRVEQSQGRLLFGMASRSIGGVEYDYRAKWVGMRFAGRTLGITFACLLIGLAFFMCIPRLWADLNPFKNESLPGQKVNFSQTVRLGQLGEILESRQPALSIQIFQGKTQVPVAMGTFLTEHGFAEPYFRGSAMDRYQHNSWSVSQESTTPIKLKLSGTENDYRQRIELESNGTPFLFCLHPVNSIDIQSPAKKEYHSDTVYSSILLVNKRNLSSRMVYDAYSPKYRQRNPFIAELISYQPTLRNLQQLFLQFPESRLPRVRELTLSVTNLTEQDLPLRTVSLQASAIEKVVIYLRDSGKYTYSLKSELSDPQIDPVEDFLFNRKEGHCEYYASALSLMLRSIGIPTRLVTGYKGGELDERSGVWKVEQRHAHAWTEAYYRNRWHTLDATPVAARDRAVASVGGKRYSWYEMKNYLAGLWSRYFVSMSFNFQKKAIYRFSWNDIKEMIHSISVSVTEMTSQSIEFLKHPSRWFSVRGGLTAFILLSVFASLGFLLSWIIRKVQAWTRFQVRERRKRRQVEFYERFLKICESQSLNKKMSQTPREFAARVSQSWNPILSANGLGNLPSSLIERFYAIRYGNQPLPASEASELLETLLTLEHVILKKDASGQ